MNCRICGRSTRICFQTTCLSKYDAAFRYCDDCGFLQAENPFWLSEAYAEPITISDTGLIRRNVDLSKITSVILFFLFPKNARFLDYAGGYGVLTRLMRDFGFDFYWHDMHTRNLFSRGFEYAGSHGSIDLVTCYEAFEHFPEPIPVIEDMLNISTNVLISTELLPNPVPGPEEWWYYNFPEGQHVSFFSKKTLERIASRYGLSLYSNGVNLHFLSKKKMFPGQYRLLLLLGQIGFSSIIRRCGASRTMADNEYLRSSHGK